MMGCVVSRPARKECFSRMGRKVAKSVEKSVRNAVRLIIVTSAKAALFTTGMSPNAKTVLRIAKGATTQKHAITASFRFS